MLVQTKEQHFTDPNETMDKMKKNISSLEVKMIKNYKELINKIKTVEKKTVEALQLAKKKEKVEINKISNH